MRSLVSLLDSDRLFYSTSNLQHAKYSKEWKKIYNKCAVFDFGYMTELEKENRAVGIGNDYKMFEENIIEAIKKAGNENK